METRSKIWKGNMTKCQWHEGAFKKREKKEIGGPRWIITDDFKAFTYTLMFLCNGSLPWLTRDQTRSSSSFIQQLKESTETKWPPKVLTELHAFLAYACNLSFTQKLNYDHLHSLLLPWTIPHTTTDEHTVSLIPMERLMLGAENPEGKPVVGRSLAKTPKT